METTIAETILNPEIAQQQEHHAWRLRIQGWNQDRIAEALNLEQSAVSRILKRVRARLAAEFTQEALEMRLEQTEQLFYVATEALLAWKETRNAAAPTPTPTPPSNLSPEIEEKAQTHTDEAQIALQAAGKQPRPCGYLKVALQAYAAIRALWGLELPKKAAAAIPTPYVEEFPYIDMERFENQHLNRKKKPDQEPLSA